MIRINLRDIVIFFLVLTICVAAEPTDTFYKEFMHTSVSSELNSLDMGGEANVGIFTGAATYSYPLKVPPGTNSLTPGIELSYNSHRTTERPGIVAAAWSISENYIERDIEHSVQDTSDDKFILHMNGQDQELIYVPSENRYHTKIESYLHITRNNGGNNNLNEYWLIKTKDGTKFRFGYNQDSEQVSNQENYVSRWYLDTITDTNENNIYYTYRENPYSGETGITYPFKIEYNNDKKRRIEFIMESSDRHDWRVTYENGNKVTLKRRLGSINVYADNNLVRRYSLSYSNTISSSYLSEIRLGDGSSTLSKASFTYFPLTKGWKAEPPFAPPVGFSGKNDNGVRFEDFNRDGFIDVLQGYKGSDDDYPEEVEIWINNKTGWSKLNTNFPYSPVRSARYYICGGTGYQYGIDRGVRFLDFNTDGFSDILVFPHKSTYGSIDRNIPRSAYSGFGTSWNRNISWDPPNVNALDWDWDYDECKVEYGIDNGVRLADLNGDNAADIVSYVNVNSLAKTWLNNKGGWTEVESWHPDEKLTSSRRADFDCPWQNGMDKGIRFIDINGDKLSDYLTSRHDYFEWDDGDSYDYTLKSVQINSGKDFVDDNLWEIPEYFTKNAPWGVICKSRFGSDQGVRFADINSDGLTDILVAKSGTRKVYLNNGRGWTQDNSWIIPIDFVNWDGENQGIRLIDVNGDGIVDVVKGKDTRTAWLNNGVKANLLKTITTEFGGTITFDYTKSTLLDNTGSDSISDMGSPLWIVSSLTKDNQLPQNNLISTTNYDYRGGYHDYGDNEFRGFSYVEEIHAMGKKEVHQFYQDDIKKGKEYSYEILDDEKQFKKIETAYETSQKDGYAELFPISVSEFIYDGTPANPKTTRASYQYDQYGNIVRELSEGDLDVSGDERISTISYQYDVNKWIVDKPAEEQLYKSNGIDKVAGKSYSYDSSGNVLSEKEWLKTGNNPGLIYTRDQYGNIKTNMDSKGGTSYYNYDTTGTYVISTINPLNQKEHFEYNFGTGNLLSKKDTNGIKTEYIYDSFGRKQKEIQPYDSEEYPTVEMVYQFDQSPPEQITLKQRETHGTESTLDSKEYYDGFGRLVQTNKEGISQDISYDSLGRLAKISVPFYANEYQVGSVNQVEFQYDVLNRIKLMKNPDTTKKNWSYDHWKDIYQDENNQTKQTIYDAYGNVKTIIEYNEGDQYITNYNYDESDNLLTIVDAQSNIVSYTYDTLGRKTRLSDPNLGIWQYIYDNNSNLILQIDNKGGQTMFEYDSLNRIINKTALHSSVEYKYDLEKNGTLSHVVSDFIEKEYHYDDRLRKISEKQSIDNEEFEFNFTYDAQDRLIKKSLPNDEQIDYTFDSRGNLHKIEGIIDNIQYDEYNLPLQKDYTNNILTNLNYGSQDHRLTNIETGVLQNLEYNHDAKGNIIQIEDKKSKSVETFSYDDLNRLETAVKLGGLSEYNLLYGYDSISNLMSIESDECNITYIFQNLAHAPSLWQKEGLQCFLRKEKINLNKGWNLIAIPLKQENEILPEALSGIKGKYSNIFTYSDSKWIELVNGSRINNTMGFWINMLENSTLNVEGQENKENKFNLIPGLNIMGSPFLIKKLINNTINSSEIDTILSYSDGNWYSYNPDRPKELRSLNWFDPGKGYIINTQSTG